MKKNPMLGTGDGSRQNLPDDPEQSKRFEDTARELEADKDREKFEKVLGTIVPSKIDGPTVRSRNQTKPREFVAGLSDTIGAPTNKTMNGHP